jgi:hypothetical protein
MPRGWLRENEVIIRGGAFYLRITILGKDELFSTFGGSPRKRRKKRDVENEDKGRRKRIQ